jgi:hypothetical protein
VARPPLPAGAKVVDSVEDAADWVTGLR